MLGTGANSLETEATRVNARVREGVASCTLGIYRLVGRADILLGCIHLVVGRHAVLLAGEQASEFGEFPRVLVPLQHLFYQRCYEEYVMSILPFILFCREIKLVVPCHLPSRSLTATMTRSICSRVPRHHRRHRRHKLPVA